MQLKRVGPAFDRIYRKNQNENLEKIEQANNTLESKMDALISGKVDDAALQTDIEQKLNDLETQYEPKLTAVTKEIEAIENNKKQVDFVDFLSRMASLNPKMSVYCKYDNWREIFINIQVSRTQGISYVFRKNTNDDYIMLMEGFLGDVENTYAATDSKNGNLNGVFYSDYPPNYWTTTIGDSITTDFLGTKINFNSYTNNQGGLWEFILDEGTGAQQTKTISVYSASPIAVQSFVLFENLDYKKHTIKATFKGQDPSNPLSAPRGWIYFGGIRPQDTKRAFEVYNDTFKINKTNDVLYSYSNKEFAINCKPKGSTNAYNWIPEHNGIGTAFKVTDAKLLINGREVTQANEMYFIDVDTVQVIQKVQGKMPYDVANPLVEITTMHTFKNGTVNVSGKIKFLRDTEIIDGYCMMLPYFKSFGDKIKSSFGNVYSLKTDGSKDFLPEQDKAVSYVVLSDIKTNENDNIALAVRFNSLEVTNRQGEIGLPTKEQFAWIENRSASMGKLYVEQFKNASINAGYVYNFDGSFVVCKIPTVNSYLV